MVTWNCFLEMNGSKHWDFHGWMAREAWFGKREENVTKELSAQISDSTRV